LRVPELDTPVNGKAEIVWVGNDGHAGARFLQIQPYQKKKLDYWLDEKFQQGMEGVMFNPQAV
jgi:hypothetical protein